MTSIDTFYVAATLPPYGIGTIPDQAWTEGAAITALDVSEYFSDLDDLVFSEGGLPAGLSLATGTGIITGTPTTPADEVTVTITATNDFGAAELTFGAEIVEATSVVSYAPADGSTDVAVGSDLVIVFSASMDTAAAATVTLKTVGGSTIETFDPSSDGTWSTTTVTDDTWTVTPASDFASAADLAVQYSDFEDDNGNPVPDVADDTTWNWSAVDLYKANGVAPELVADFVADYYRLDGSPDAFADLLTFSRASSATMVNSSGALVTKSTDQARVGHHVWSGSEWVNKGLLFEQASTNVLLNSDTLSTQDVTVTADPYVLHFTGTGSITLSGAHSATLAGTGTGEENRVSLSFTPSAGTLTITVSGTVSNAQLEQHYYATSYISTGGSTVTRAADSMHIDPANLPIATDMSFAISGAAHYTDTAQGNIKPWRWYQDGNDYVDTFFVDNNGKLDVKVSDGTAGSFRADVSSVLTEQVNSPFSYAIRVDGGTELATAVDGTVGATDTGNVTIHSGLSDDDLTLGDGLDGWISLFRVWGADIGDTGIEEAS